MTNNILIFTGEITEKSGFKGSNTFTTEKNNIISLADEKVWRILYSQLVKDETDSIAEILTQVFQKRRERDLKSAEIIQFKKRA